MDRRKLGRLIRIETEKLQIIGFNKKKAHKMGKGMVLKREGMKDES